MTLPKGMGARLGARAGRLVKPRVARPRKFLAEPARTGITVFLYRSGFNVNVRMEDENPHREFPSLIKVIKVRELREPRGRDDALRRLARVHMLAGPNRPRCKRIPIEETTIEASIVLNISLPR